MTGPRMKSVAALSAFAAAAFFCGGNKWLLPRAKDGSETEPFRRRLSDSDDRKRARKNGRAHQRQGNRRGESSGSRGLTKFTDPKTVTRKSAQLRQSAVSSELSVAPYNIENVMLALQHFDTNFFVWLYVAQRDEFVALYDESLPWNAGAARIRTDGHVLSYALRKQFPERFKGKKGKSSDLAFLATVGDSIHFSSAQCLDPEYRHRCKLDKFAPIFVFGSAFNDQEMLPSQIPMPMPPKPHMPCFSRWQESQKVCQDLQPRNGDSGPGLVFEEHVGVGWDDLIPTVIWRGTDFAFLHQMFKDLRKPAYGIDVKPKIAEYGKDPAAVIRALYDSWDELLPRWKGVLLTAEAELEASQRDDGSVPWADIKFASYIEDRKRMPCSEGPFYRAWNKLGIPAYGKSVYLDETAHYKYHIDLGGGGGTTWTGTINKLSMPGVLFHHVTPTKDWFHDHIEPWVHYIPVSVDLSDLKERYEWAEANPEEARKISDNATEFARWIGTPKGFEQLYNKYFVDNLRAVIDAYQPGDDVPMKAFAENHSNMKVVMRCDGKSRHSCKVVGEAADVEDLDEGEWASEK